MSAEDWTPDRVGLLRTLWAQGLSASQIAKRLGGGITRNAVIGKRIRVGLPDRVTSTRSYSRKPKPAVCSPFPPRKPKPAPPLDMAPVRKPRAPVRGPNAVRFMGRRPDQCPMFCAGEELANGFVCGEAVAFGSSWCASCTKICYQPLPPAQRKAA